MGLKWRSLLFYAGIVLLVQTACFDAARVPKASARVLAEKTGAAHYEERSSEEGQEHQLRKRASDEDFDYEVYQGVVGRPGIDFPILPRIPQTTFSCRTFGNGYFADLETECQVFHICDDGRKISFLCPNGTIFQQSELICDWWFKVNCPASPGHYVESAEMLSRSQGRKRPSYTKKVENDFHSNGNGYSRTAFNDKSQYPFKKDNRKFEDSPDRVIQGKKKGHRFESDEVPSLENFDFEDISDNRHESGKLKTSKSDPNDTEMQDVAETASFVGNGQRRNGYNYDTLHEGQKPYNDQKGYDRTKNGRGRQKYRGDTTKPPRGRSQNLGEEADKNSFTARDRSTTGRGGITRKFEGESHSTPGLIHQKKPTLPTTSPQTTRDRTGSHTTPRRLDNSRTTPYYTPTVPTIRATETTTAQRTDFGAFPTTTETPGGISEYKDSPTKTGENFGFGRNLDHPQRIPGHTGTTDPISTLGISQQKLGASISGTFAVSGPPAVTIPPHDQSFEPQKTGPSSTSFGSQGLPSGTVSPLDNFFASRKTGSFGSQGPSTQDFTGYSYQIPSIISQTQFLNSTPSPLRPFQSVTSGTASVGFSGTPKDTGSSKNSVGVFGSKPSLDGGRAETSDYPGSSQGGRGLGGSGGSGGTGRSGGSGGSSRLGASGRSGESGRSGGTGGSEGAGGSGNNAGYSYKTPSKQTEGSTKSGIGVQIQSTQGTSDSFGKSIGEQSTGLSTGSQIGAGSPLSQKGGARESSEAPAQSNAPKSIPYLTQRAGASTDSSQRGSFPSLPFSGGVRGHEGGDSKTLGDPGIEGDIVGNLKPTGRGKIQTPTIGQGGGTGKVGIKLQTVGEGTESSPQGGFTVTGRSGIGGNAGQISSTSSTLLSVGLTTTSQTGGNKSGSGASFTDGPSFTDGSSNTATPLVIGMRGTIATDPAHKRTDSSSPIIAVNVLSDGTFGGKVSGPSPANSVHGSVLGDSNVKVTTFKPLSSSSTTNGLRGFSGSAYLLKDATTVRPSSAGPTYLPKPTKPSSLPESVSEHVDEMIKSLSDLKDGIGSTKNRVGLEIPPSSGPETLHSLALYFAGEGDKSNPTTETGEPTATVKADISAVPLSNKTVQEYEALFGLGSTTDKAVETTLTPDLQSRVSNDLEAQHSSNLLGDAAGKGETRKIAQVFTNALSAYLEDPATFRKTLTEVRPTEPPSTEENEVTTQTRTTSAYFNKGTAASYLPTAPTTVFPSTTTDDLEVLDFSDVTISTGQRGQTPLLDSTTDAPTTRSPNLKGGLNRIPASSLTAARREKQSKHLRGGDETSSNQIAVEINKGLGLSTVIPLAADSGKTALPRSSAGITTFSTTSSPEGTTTNLPLIFDLLPPVSGGKSSNLGLPSSDILPPGYDDDEDTLQRAQSQSFVAARNRMGKEDAGKSDKGSKSGTKTPGHYITRLISDAPTTTEYPEGVSPWFLDPLTINDGLMDEFRTTTASPYTYLPKVPSSTTETSPVHLDLTSMLNRVHLTDSKADRLGKALPGIPEDLLPPENGMQRIANKVFGSLNESSADHLMNVMRKAEDNPTVRRLILLLIQTCGDDDYSKTVEQSRQVLLNALIGMDDKLGLDDEVEVIRLRPKQNRRGKSIAASDKNSVISSTTEYPVTTFRRDINAYTISTENPGSTTQNPSDETTRFEIHVEDPDEGTRTTTTEPDFLNLSTTTTRPGQETTPSYSTSDSSVSTISPLNFGDVPRVNGSRRTSKDVETSLSQPNLSHKSSDERALELLKSLYSLASKFGRR